MKILYAVLGAGNGHVSRAREVLPHLEKHGDVDVAISGTDSQVEISSPVKYKCHGLIFHLGKKGGLDYWRTLGDLKVPTLLRDIRSFPVKRYDVVINDFEPITARAAQREGVACASLSHQASFQSTRTPQPRQLDPIAKAIIRYYAPCKEKIGFHFERYDEFIRTPVIRREIRELPISNAGHITVYLPAYDDQSLIELFRKIPKKKWQLFSKRARMQFSVDNISVKPIQNEDYLASLASCDGLLTGGDMFIAN